jgi:hypothetical protein
LLPAVPTPAAELPPAPPVALVLVVEDAPAAVPPPPPVEPDPLDPAPPLCRIVPLAPTVIDVEANTRKPAVASAPPVTLTVV